MAETWLFGVIILAFLILFLLILSWSHLNIPRDPGCEGVDNQDSILAYDQVNRWILFFFIRNMFTNQLKKIPLQGKLMDAGCGPGYLAIKIASQFPQLDITGVDFSKMMIDLATQHQKETGFNNIQFQEADVQKLPFNNADMDCIFSTLSLHHWLDSHEALKEFHRVLKPGGNLLILDIRRDAPLFFYYLLRFGQRFLAPPSIRRINGGVGSLWSSYTLSEAKVLMSLTPFRDWKIFAGWAWFYIRARK